MSKTQLEPPSPEEMAAILAAVELCWPRPTVAAAPDPRAETPRWRFSGRSWAKPVPLVRDRPG